MLKVLLGNKITDVKGYSTVVFQTNGVGVVDQNLLDQIDKDDIIKKEIATLFKLDKKLFQEGNFFITKPGKLEKNSIESIYFAVLTRLPKSVCSFHNITISLNNIFKFAIRKKVKSIAVIDFYNTSLGIDMDSVARILVTTSRNYCSSNLDILLFATDPSFYESLNKSMI